MKIEMKLFKSNITIRLRLSCTSACQLNLCLEVAKVVLVCSNGGRCYIELLLPYIRRFVKYNFVIKSFDVLISSYFFGVW